jgi:cbb3-type cytochrome oxidase subunit 3
MYRQLLEKSPLLALPLFALFLFLIAFAAVVIRTYARRADSYAKTAGMPLADDTGPSQKEGEDHV